MNVKIQDCICLYIFVKAIDMGMHHQCFCYCTGIFMFKILFMDSYMYIVFIDFLIIIHFRNMQEVHQHQMQRMQPMFDPSFLAIEGHGRNSHQVADLGRRHMGRMGQGNTQVSWIMCITYMHWSVFLLPVFQMGCSSHFSDCLKRLFRR